ncbi:hypothetical protein D3C76_912820 [compost metagenome]
MLELIPLQEVLVGTHDHRVTGGDHVVANQQLFIELLARTQPSELDGDIAEWITLGADTETGQVNHLFRQFDDPHRLAHVEHEHIAALAHRARLDHQLRGFGDGHEIAGDLRVGDGQWATGLDLLVEQRNHRT